MIHFPSTDMDLILGKDHCPPGPPHGDPQKSIKLS